MISTLSFDQEHQVYQFDDLRQLKTVAHAITTRNSFFIPGFNISFHTGEEHFVLQNRSTLQHFFKGESLTIPKQCHGMHVVAITEENKNQVPQDTDALVTNVSGQVIGVLSADCVPILLYDPIKQAIGVAHAGWKGTVGNIVTSAIVKMQSVYGSLPADIMAYIGPSISAPNFEVGKEVASQFETMDLSVCLDWSYGDKPHINLWLANHLLLQRAGVKNENITTAGICTYDHTNQFYSARKEGFETGRFGIFAMLI